MKTETVERIAIKIELSDDEARVLLDALGEPHSMSSLIADMKHRIVVFLDEANYDYGEE